MGRHRCSACGEQFEGDHDCAAESGTAPDFETVDIECAECGNRGEVPDWWPGHTAECKDCGATMRIPEVRNDGE